MHRLGKRSPSGREPLENQRLKIKKMFREVSQGLIRDQESLRQRLQSLQRSVQKDEAVATEWVALQARLSASIKNREKRRVSLPKPRYPDDLPVAQQREAVAQKIQKHPVVVLCGETGSGKTTQLPKICLDLQRGTAGWIGVTQPRRIAARTIADFLAHDLQSEMGAAVGYKMRFTDRVSPDSFIKVMTDGILLAEIQSDRMLSRYDTLIIDEAHERSLNIDFILGYLKQLIPRRPDLKVIISSATLDTHRFSQHFDQAPVMEVSGRTYPVEIRYRPLDTLDEGEEAVREGEEKALEHGIREAVHELFALGPSGDILIFLPGEREIRETADFLRKQALPATEVLPLFARLSMADQHRIFHPGKRRRIILATNVAETSITVPGIRYVVDSGLARISRHSGRTQVRRLPVEKISRAAADQRKGRCGRLSDGICIRLFSQEDFVSRPLFTDPEILRSSLASVILQMNFLKLGTVEKFPFVDPPTANAIRDGARLLAELGAVTDRGKITQTGRDLARLPLDPRLGRMILAGHTHACLNEMLVIVSAMSIPDPRQWPEEHRGKAELAHKRYQDPASDFMGFLNLWAFIETGRQEAGSKNRFVRFLKENFLSVVRVFEWQGIREQLAHLAKSLGLKQAQNAAGFMEIHKAVLVGSLGFIGFKTENRDYAGARQNRFFISPGSDLFKKSPTWIVAGELVETTRLFASTCARVEPEWIEAVAGPLCRKKHFDPHWEKKSGFVQVFEQVTLFGLILMARRKVPFGPVDGELARKIFIQAALVEGQFQTTAEFFAHNHGLVAEVRELEHKSRRRDLLVDAQDLFDFYDGLIPEHVHSGHLFHAWYWQAYKKNNRLLFFTRDMLLRHAGEGITGESFPGYLQVHGQKLPLEYHFNPGDGEDGISVCIPLPCLNQLSAPMFEWLVPGLLPNKIQALLKALPKTWRRALVPLPQAGRFCLDHFQVSDRNKPLESILGRLLRQRYGVEIPADAWRFSDLPDHLRMNFKVVDEKTEKVLAQGRDLGVLQKKQGTEAKKSFGQLSKAGFERVGLTRWNFGDLPQQVVIPRKDAGTVYGFPAIQDDGATVSLRLLDDPYQARRITRWGLVCLFALQLPQQVRLLEKTLAPDHSMILAHASLGGRETLLREMIVLVLARVFLEEEEAIETEALFQKRLHAGRGRLPKEAKEVYGLVRAILEHHHALHGMLREMKTPGLRPIAEEVRSHWNMLVFTGFFREIPPVWLKHLPRYLQAIRLRLERRAFAPQKDAQKAKEIQPLWQQYQTLAKKQAQAKTEDPELQQYRWMLEEFRVSLFAQDLRTIFPVSAKRLVAQWERVLR